MQQTKDLNDQVGDTTDQVNDQVGDTTDQVNDQVGDTVNEQTTGGDQSEGLSNTTNGRDRDAADKTGDESGAAGEASNQNPPSSSDVESIAGGGNDVSGDDNSADASDADPAGGLLAFTGTQGLVVGAMVGSVLIALGVTLLSMRRRNRQRAARAAG